MNVKGMIKIEKSPLVKNITVIVAGKNHQRMLKLIGGIIVKKKGHLRILKVSPYKIVITKGKTLSFY